MTFLLTILIISRIFRLLPVIRLDARFFSLDDLLIDAFVSIEVRRWAVLCLDGTEPSRSLLAADESGIGAAALEKVRDAVCSCVFHKRLYILYLLTLDLFDGDPYGPLGKIHSFC